MHLLVECREEGTFFNGIIDKNFRSMYFCFQSDNLALYLESAISKIFMQFLGFIKMPKKDRIGSHYA
jgi:hypothetical protein